MARCTTDPRPVLRDGDVYWADNGRRICARCAGASALYAGHDLSGQPVERVTVDDVHAWPEDLGPLNCEAHCTTLAGVAGPDGWPLERRPFGFPAARGAYAREAEPHARSLLGVTP